MLAAVAPQAGWLAEFFFSLTTLILLPGQTPGHSKATPETGACVGGSPLIPDAPAQHGNAIRPFKNVGKGAQWSPA
jgi:hypothetical protein